MANLWPLQKMFQALTISDPSLGSEAGGIGLNNPHNLSSGPGSSSSGLQQPHRAAHRTSFPVLPPLQFAPLPPQDPRLLSGFSSPTPTLGAVDPRTSHNPFSVPFPHQFVPLPPQDPRPLSGFSSPAPTLGAVDPRTSHNSFSVPFPPQFVPLPQSPPVESKSWDLSLLDALPPRAHHPPIHVPPPTQFAPLPLPGRRPLPEPPSAPMTTKGKNREFGVVENRPLSPSMIFDNGDSIDVQDPPEYVDPFEEFRESESDSLLSDIEFAIALQIEEIETLNETLEDEEIARRLQAEINGLDILPPNVTPSTYNPRPRRSQAASNAAAGPSIAAVSKIRSACTSCYDTLENLEGLRSSCGHSYCFTCVRSMVNAGLEGGGTLFPPRCCQTLLVPDEETAPKPSSSKNKDRDISKEEGRRQIQLLGLALNDPELVAKMETKWHEMSMDPGDRVYCCNPGCSLFLGSASSPPPSLSASPALSSASSSSPSSSSRTPHSSSTSPPSSTSPISFFRRFSGPKTNAATTAVIAHRLQCPKCFTLTCAACKQTAHAGQSCTEKVDNQFWDLVNVKSWKRCPHCKSVVEKNGGCSQVQCRCGRPFTYA